MKFITGSLAAIVLATTISCHSGRNPHQVGTRDTTVTLKNAEASVEFAMWGGALVSFRLANDTVNPFTWQLSAAGMPPNNQNGAPFRGHFLCTGRWGSPTPGEIRSGIPHNGEPSNVWWEVKEKTENGVVMYCNAVKEGLSVERSVQLGGSSVMEVTEVFSNKLNVARNIPVVQHATIAAPFLDKQVLINSNAKQGFNQKFVPGDFLKFQSFWPFLQSDTAGNTFDIRNSNQTEGFVGTYIFSDSIGWVTAWSPQQSLLLGYMWRTSDYPWLHIWHGIQNGELTAKGLEFGTTGLGDTSPLEERFLLNFHGRTNLSYVDANSSVSKRYLCFLIRVDEGVDEVKTIGLVPEGVVVSVMSKGKEYQKILKTTPGK